MNDYIDINTEEQASFSYTPISITTESEQNILIPYNPKSLEFVEIDSELLDGKVTKLDIPEYPQDLDTFQISLLEVVEENKEDCLDPCDDCDADQLYGPPSPEGFFRKENLFSELTTEYERAIVRKNLGIGSEGAMIWGYIDGNIANQKDLYDFVINTNSVHLSNLIQELNMRLSQWGFDIKTSLSEKAGIESPNFTGEPKVTTPHSGDYSNRIPTTEWVTNKFNEISIGSLNWIRLSQNYKYTTDPAIQLIVNWEYNEPVESQSINGIALNKDIRVHIFDNVNSSRNITLSYIVDGTTFSRTLYFESVAPIYYGKTNNYSQNTKTRNNKFIIDTGNSSYGYIFTPGTSLKRIAVDNIIGGFLPLGVTTLDNSPYYAYRTYNSGLGQLNIEIL